MPQRRQRSAHTIIPLSVLDRLSLFEVYNMQLHQMSRPFSHSAILLLALATLTLSVNSRSVVHGEEKVEFGTPEVGKWVSIFNGKDLTGWTPKIKGYEYGDNFADTFRVIDGMLSVRYDGYEKFDRKFGHLFYKDNLSNYRMRVEYRFVGDQCAGGEGWATRNSGIMIHGEDPKGMGKDQDFPTSIEVQLLGGLGTAKRTTSNLCTPGTNVVKEGKLFMPHCTTSSSETYHGDQWVVAEIEVRGNKVIKHIIDGKVVLEYSEPQLDLRDAHAKELASKRGDDIQLSGGSVSLQSESHPCDFRRVEVMLLEE
ncbi:MAG: DUF1080 domain-containing protein [Planctomycetaceae bacterium]